MKHAGGSQLQRVLANDFEFFTCILFKERRSHKINCVDRIDLGKLQFAQKPASGLIRGAVPVTH